VGSEIVGTTAKMHYSTPLQSLQLGNLADDILRSVHPYQVSDLISKDIRTVDTALLIRNLGIVTKREIYSQRSQLGIVVEYILM